MNEINELKPNAAADLSIIVPTFNEADNVRPLIARLETALAQVRWEVIFVDDDSADGTADIIRHIARSDMRVRCLLRIGRRGLAGAAIEGMLSSAAPYVAVMDADLQHDETLLIPMLQRLRSDKADVVIGTRYGSGGGIGGWTQGRASMSRLATKLSRFVCRRDVSDPLSGFFALRRKVLDSSMRNLSAIGFKVLLDILASAPKPLRIVELPYTFRARTAGESKLDAVVVWEFGMLLVDKAIGRYIPVRFLSFSLVGGFGILVHFATLTTLLKGFHVVFPLSQTIATFVAIISNFAVNNVLTYSDRRLHGWRWLAGLTSFAAACGVGAIANVGIATYLFESRAQWFLAALAGVLVGAVWNYVMTRTYTWGDAR